ncbi:MAG TPA: hypothetical protein DCL66_01965 [Gammaproteobacteria bacterium]|nr:hypothetical protein [Gammaproteobacteria bacterium]
MFRGAEAKVLPSSTLNRNTSLKEASEVNQENTGSFVTFSRCAVHSNVYIWSVRLSVAKILLFAASKSELY